MNMLETLPPEAIGGTLGISGKGAEFLSTAMGRIHAVPSGHCDHVSGGLVR